MFKSKPKSKQFRPDVVEYLVVNADKRIVYSNTDRSLAEKKLEVSPNFTLVEATTSYKEISRES